MTASCPATTITLIAANNPNCFSQLDGGVRNVAGSNPESNTSPRRTYGDHTRTTTISSAMTGTTRRRHGTPATSASSTVITVTPTLSGKSQVFVIRVRPMPAPSTIPRRTAWPRRPSLSSLYQAMHSVPTASRTAMPITCGCTSPNSSDHAGNSVTATEPGMTRLIPHQSTGP